MAELEITVGAGGQRIHHHAREDCDGPPCPFHSPSLHLLVEAPMNYRNDRRLLERICVHGVGHPDPDSLAFGLRHGGTDLGVHGCCGCCRRVPSPFDAVA